MKFKPSKSAQIATLIVAALFCSQLFSQTTTTTTGTTSTTSDTTMTPASSSVTTTTPGSITTTTTTTTTSDDPALVSAVQAKIALDPSLPPNMITVNTMQGVVTLGGTVQTQAQADDAVAAAKSVVGVKDVKSTMTVAQAVNQNTTTTTTTTTSPSSDTSNSGGLSY